MTMGVVIYNIKKSVRVQANKILTYKWFEGRAIKRQKRIRYIKNFIIVYDKFCLTCFYMKTGDIHINITKIKSLKELNEIEEWLYSKYLPSNARIIQTKVDNYFAKGDLNRRVDISRINNYNNVSQYYNRERFPALFLKCCYGSVCIFNSGKVTIIGVRSVCNLKHIWLLIQKLY